jgi:putative ABC transport system permease protein
VELRAPREPRAPSAAFEERLLKPLRAEAPEWTFGLRSVELERQRYIRSRLLPLASAARWPGSSSSWSAWASWASSGRMSPAGPRSWVSAAHSAPPRAPVRNQIIGEIVVLTMIALFIGTVLFLQLPLLGVLSFVGVGVFVSAIVAASLVIVPFVVLCGLYPGWLATQVEPSQALQYE